MRRQLTLMGDRLLIAPARSLLDTTALLLTRPAYAARTFAAEKRLAQVVTYFVAAFSTAVILNKLASTILGIETIDDVPFWSIHLGVILAIVAVAALFGVFFRPSPSMMFLKAALLAYGASFLMSSFLLAGASLTLWGLREVGYIPDFKVDLSAYPNFVAIGERAYYECLRNESTLFNALFNAAGGAYAALRHPIDDLSYVQPILHVAASFLFATLAFFAASRRRPAAAMAAVLGCVVIFGAFPFGFGAFADYLQNTSPCSERSVQAAGERTAEDQVRVLAEKHAANVGRIGGHFTLVGVEVQQRTLVLKVRVNERATDKEGFEKWVSSFRQKVVGEFCRNSDYGAYFRKLGITQVWVLQYIDSDLVETVVESADQCRR